MNTIPRLFENLSWQTIASFSGNELIELAMPGILAAGLIGVVIYWIYRAAAAFARH